VGFGLSNKSLPFFPICHQLSPSSLNPSSFTFTSIHFNYSQTHYDILYTTLQYSRVNSTKSPASGAITVARFRWCHKSSDCANLCTRRSIGFCYQRSGDCSIHLLTYYSSHATEVGGSWSLWDSHRKLSSKMSGTL
jgi:hypothetical protein